VADARSAGQLELFADALAESARARADPIVADDRPRRPNAYLEVDPAGPTKPSAPAGGTRSVADRATRTKPAGGQRTCSRLAVSPGEAAEMLGVSRDHFDEHIIGDLRVVRRGRRILIALTELERGIASGAIRTRTGERYKPSVVREYERSLRFHVLPTLGGGARLSRIQRRDVQRLADDLLASGADPSTIRNALKPLQVLYRRAIEDGDLAVNPCERLRLPAARGRRERIASPTEAAALIAALRPEDRALWGCAFYGGLRRGELRALLWDDVDLAGGLIRIERSMSSHGETGEPKSRAGRRGVPIVAALRDLVVEHKLVTRRDSGLVLGSSASQPFTSDSSPQASPDHMAARRTRSDWTARVSAHVRQSANCCRRKREGDHCVPRPRIHSDNVRPLRPPHARQRGGVSDAGRRIPRASRHPTPARPAWTRRVAVLSSQRSCPRLSAW